MVLRDFSGLVNWVDQIWQGEWVVVVLVALFWACPVFFPLNMVFLVPSWSLTHLHSGLVDK